MGAPDGSCILNIPFSEMVTNLVFGGNVLYLTGAKNIYSLEMQVRGATAREPATSTSLPVPPSFTSAYTKIDNGFCPPPYMKQINNIDSADPCADACEAETGCKYFSVGRRCRLYQDCPSRRGPDSGYVSYQVDSKPR